jgi:hypothetical protein
MATFLTPREVDRLARVSREWQTLASDNELWNMMLQRYGLHYQPEILASLRGHQYDIGHEQWYSPKTGRFDDEILSTISEYCGESVENAVQVFKNPYPALAFGREEWLQCLGDPGEAPPLPSNLYEILQKNSLRENMLVLVPATVTIPDHGRLRTFPLTLNLLDQLVRYSPRGDGTAFFDMTGVSEALKNMPVDKSHWVLMFKRQLVDSEEDGYDFLEQSLARDGFEVPHLMDTAVAIFSYKLLLGKRLFSYSEEFPQYSSITYCQEMSSDDPKWHLSIGAYSSLGLIVCPGRLFCAMLGRSLDKCSGVAAMKRL